jgi:PIN domain nuclease of toxin-antitoxin system
MNVLLDTHAFLWFIGDDAFLSTPARRIIESAENEVYLSMASIWEMAIKVSLGKLEMPSPFTDFVTTQLSENTVRLLDIGIAHVGMVTVLPFHHRDPFDRLIIAQSLSENIPIIGREAVFDDYGIQRLW